MLVICCGMNRSASTLRYQIAKHLVEKAGGEALGYELRSDWRKIKPRQAANAKRWYIVKTHEPDPDVEARLDPDRTYYIYSYRDVRDVFASKTQRHGEMPIEEFEQKLRRILACHEHFVGRKNVIVSRYEDWKDNVAGEIERYERFLGIPLSGAERERLADELSIDRQKTYLQKLTDRDLVKATGSDSYVDRDSLMHVNHIRDGAVGKWRDVLTPEQIDLIHEIAGDWLQANGYEFPARA